MADSSEKIIEKTNETKELVKKMNVDAVARVLTDMKNYTYKVKSEQAGLTQTVLKVTQDIAELKTHINVLKAMAARGTIGGRGSTVHKQGE